MWCWHRIRENENGLCPACRTPYGDDPHEFSAIDMEEVVRANKEKAAAEKRERDRTRAAAGARTNGDGAGSRPPPAAYSNGGNSSGDTDGNNHHSSLSLVSGPTPPRDRSQLANMRVIRRNLVYAVGLPPSSASDDMLRRSEHFGQYGRIGKVVLNRSHIGGGGDPRRASASAYVTFVNKEDALACILALDGFYLDGRNIRASYGTSKYCSAFIKNVRCNNPECTYLHHMGEAEDTFTKQEIQAGYVTSGRDVLAKLQAGGGSCIRKRSGGGGPSSSGKACVNPVFPPPTWDEPIPTPRAAPAPSPTPAVIPQPAAVIRAVTVPVSTSRSRSSSLSTNQAPAAPSSAPSTTQQTPSEILSRQQEELRKMHPQNSATGTSLPRRNSAASVVACAAQARASQSPPAGRALPTGVPLRTVATSNASRAPPGREAAAATSVRQQEGTVKLSALRQRAPGASTSNTTSSGGVIGGSVLIGGASSGVVGPSSSRQGNLYCQPVGAVGQPVGAVSNNSNNVPTNLGGYLEESKSGNAFGVRKIEGGTGVMDVNGASSNNSQSNPFSDFPMSLPRPQAPIMSRAPGQNSSYGGGGGSYTGTGGLFSGGSFAGIGGGGIWSSDPSSSGGLGKVGGPSGSNGGMVGENSLAKNPYEGSGSSALASILGIELPTGSGSLRDTVSYLSSGPQMTSTGISVAPGPVTPRGVVNNDHSIWRSSSLSLQGDNNNPSFLRPNSSNNNGFHNKTNIRNGVAAIGSISNGSSYGGSGLSVNNSSGMNSNSNNNSDIAFLQSLLPGVHITSGNAHQPAAPSPAVGVTRIPSVGGWSSLSPYYETSSGDKRQTPSGGQNTAAGGAPGTWQFPNQNSIW